MFTSIQKQMMLKLFSMFVVVRGFNLALIVIAQYITAIFIMAPSSQSLSEILFDRPLFALILATVGAIASGYIINNFYDSEKDVINRPHQSILEQYVSQNTKLILYFVINFIVVIIASYVSFRSVLFFSIYIFSIWFYSHKIKKMPIVGNLISAILTITPFFAIFLYYKNYSGLIFVFGFYLFLVLSMRELVKDLENLKGDQIVINTDRLILSSRFGETLHFSKERYDVGLLNAFDFSQATLALENAQSEVIRTKYDYIFRTKILEFYFGIPLIKKQ